MKLRKHKDAALMITAIAVSLATFAAVNALDEHDAQQAQEKQVEAAAPIYWIIASEPADVIELPVEPEKDPEAAYYDVPLDHETQDLLMQACEESGVDVVLALAVISQETDFRNISGDGGASAGYMQIQKRWHSERMDRLGVTDLFDPLSNFRVGCDFLAELLGKYTVEDTLTAYNSGKPGHSEYAKSVMNRMEAIREA